MTLEKELELCRKRKKELIEQSNGQLQTMSTGLRIEFRELRGREVWLQEAIKKRNYNAKKIRDKSNLGERFSRRNFDTFDESKQPRPYKVCKAYAEHFQTVRSADKNSLILMGNCGTGKTHLVASITNYVIENFGVMVLFATWSDHLEKIKSEFKSSKNEYLDKMRSIDLLVIDDFGQEKRTEWTDEILFSVVNARYERCLPMLMTTNLMSLNGHMRDSVQSRLLEVAVEEVVKGEDYRT